MTSGPLLPILSPEELFKLERAYPPRCIRAGEAFEDHLRYAGKVDLVQSLRATYEEALDDNKDVPLDDAQKLEAYIERQGQEIT